MPNNFRISGSYYVSKAGSDSNSGTSPESPKRTIQAVITAASRLPGTVVIGAGVYTEVLSAVATYNMNLVADGAVTIRAPLANISNMLFTSNYNATRTFYATGITFENFNNIEFQTSGINTPSPIEFRNCTFKYTNFYCIFGAAFVYMYGCKFINSNIEINTVSANGVGIRLIDGCVFINSKVSIEDPSSNVFINSYTNSNSSIDVLPTNMNYNNMQSRAIRTRTTSSLSSGVYQDSLGKYYDLSRPTAIGDGTFGNPYGKPYTSTASFSFDVHKAIYPTINSNSFSADPKFNNVLTQDFSLQPDSPHVGNALDRVSNIGDTYVAVNVPASGSLFSGSGALVENLYLSQDGYIVSGSNLSGSVTSAPILVSPTAKVINAVEYVGMLRFNKDTTAQTGSNIQVPDAVTYTSASGEAGANPDRLTYYMRWTTGSSQPVVDSDWDNGALKPAGSYTLFEWNYKPSFDYSNDSAGDPSYDAFAATPPTYVKATYVQLKVVIRNNYLI